MQQSTEAPACEIRRAYFDGIRVTGKHKMIFFIIMVAYFFEQMDNWNFAFVAPAMFKTWGLTAEAIPTAMSVILFWYFIGMTLGGFLGGVISDLIGRRKTFLYSIVLFSAGSIITGLPLDNLLIFTVARSLTGFGVFCMMVCSQTYIAEMSPCETRGKWQGLIAAIGFLAVPVIAFLCRLIIPLSPEAWRWIFYFGGAGLLAFMAGLAYLKESPRWLVSRGKVQEAEAIVLDITGVRVDLSEAAKNVPPKQDVKAILTGMFTGKYIKRTAVILFVFICVTPAAFLFNAWTPQLLTGIMVPDASGNLVQLYDQKIMLTIMTIISCGVPAGCFLASRIADMGGRKIPLVAVYALGAVSSVIMAQVIDNVYAVMVFGFLISTFNMAGGFIVFSYTAESYPTHMRNTAVGFLNGLARLSVSAFQRVVPFLFAAFSTSSAFSNINVIFYTSAILLAAPLVFVLLFGERTGGKSLEEIN